jgi:CMP-N,N'-diacetyllegionaminic acid synthase
MKDKLIALIPARSGSERLKNKNILKLGKLPLMAYTIRSAIESKIFEKIIVSTDSTKYAKIARMYGAEVPFLRPKNLSGSRSSDYEWVSFTMSKLKRKGLEFSHFFILRPTSPFRKSSTILRAWREFKKNKTADSLRAIEVCTQHPGKMWIYRNKFIKPILNNKKKQQPLYNLQFKSLPRVYVQNASLEISRTSVLKFSRSITGSKIIPFFTKHYEGYDINNNYDFLHAEYLLKNKKLVI